MARYNPPMPTSTRPVFRYMQHFTVGGRPYYCNLYYQQDIGATTVPTPATLANALSGPLFSGFADVMAAAGGPSGWTCWELTNPTLPPVSAVTTFTPGVRVGSPMPAFVSAGLYRRTNQIGQKSRGMIRIPGLSEDDTAGDDWTAGMRAALTSLGLVLKAPRATPNPTDGTFTAVLASVTGTGTGSSVACLPITAWQVGRSPGTQGTRKLRPNL